MNTVMVMAALPQRRRSLKQQSKTRLGRFAASRVPFAGAIRAAVFTVLEHDTLYGALASLQIVKRSADRSVLWDQQRLRGAAVEDAELGVGLPSYEANNRGLAYSPAPEILFTLSQQGNGTAVRLGKVAEVRRGFTPSAHEFFRPEPVGRTVKGPAEPAREHTIAPVRVENRAGLRGKIEDACRHHLHGPLGATGVGRADAVGHGRKCRR